MGKVNKKAYHVIFITIIAILIVVVLTINIFQLTVFSTSTFNNMLHDTLVRIVGSLLFIYFLIRFGYKDMFQFSFTKTVMIFSLPALLISLNNFPISAYLNGRYVVNMSNSLAYLFAFESISVGLFEEIIFRGLLLIVLIQYLPKTKKGNFIAVMLSSLLFGLIHIFNIFYGGAFGPTVLQVGYSFLMGMMWAVIYLKTRNIWIVMVLHTTYNYFGNVLFELGTVTNRFDFITVVVTILFSAFALVYYFYHFIKMDIVED